MDEEQGNPGGIERPLNLFNPQRPMNSGRPTPYAQLNDVLRRLVEGVQTALGDNFMAAWLQGSFAVGDYDLHSDVDFIIAIQEELSSQQVETLQILHGRIFELESRWAQHLEGSYFPEDVLRHHERRDEELWYLDNGARSLIRSDHCNTVVVRRTLRQHGVILAGPSAHALIDPIPVQLLRREILDTIQVWGQEILDQPERYNNRFYQGFITLNFCRMLRDMQAGEVGSKRDGAEWAKANLDPLWAEHIERAWGGRPNPAVSVREPADPAEMARTLALVRFVMAASLEMGRDLGIM